jgi:hypothetical protein
LDSLPSNLLPHITLVQPKRFLDEGAVILLASVLAIL